MRGGSAINPFQDRQRLGLGWPRSVDQTSGICGFVRGFSTMGGTGRNGGSRHVGRTTLANDRSQIRAVVVERATARVDDPRRLQGSCFEDPERIRSGRCLVRAGKRVGFFQALLGI